jgi:hypothetical protein
MKNRKEIMQEILACNSSYTRKANPMIGTPNNSCRWVSNENINNSCPTHPAIFPAQLLSAQQRLTLGVKSSTVRPSAFLQILMILDRQCCAACVN